MYSNIMGFLMKKIVFITFLTLVFCGLLMSCLDADDAKTTSLTGTVVITGTLQVGKTISANAAFPGTYTGAVSYKWYRGDNYITGANARNYLLVEADENHNIKVEVQREGFTGSVFSNPVGPVAGINAFQLRGSISISGTAQVGETLTLVTADVNASTNLTIRWYRNDILINGANANTYILTEADEGRLITVKLTAIGFVGELSSALPSGPVISRAAKYTAEFRGEWIRMDNGDKWYVERNRIRVNGNISNLDVTLVRVSDNVATANNGAITLFASRLANSSFNAHVVFPDASSVSPNIVSRSLLGGFTIPQMIIKPLNQPDLEIKVDPDPSTGAITVPCMIKHDPVVIIPDDPDWKEIKVELTPPDGDDMNMGIIPLTKGSNHKVSVRMKDPEKDNISELYADGFARAYIFEIENIGTTDSTGASYQISFNDDDFELTSGIKNGILDTIVPGGKRQIELGLRSKPIQEGSRVREINVRTRYVDGQAVKTWDDTVSLNYHKIAIPFNFRSRTQVQGVIKTPRGETLYFRTTRTGSTGDYSCTVNVPWSDDDYIIAFLGATAQTGTETVYSLGINEAAPSNWALLTSDMDALYRYHGVSGSEETAPEINMTEDRSFMYYLYSNAVQYFRINLGDEPPENIYNPESDRILVTSASDAAGSATQAGTLRYALTNAKDGDVIRFSDPLTVELIGALPQITKSLTIEGNGSTLTRHSSWTETSATSQLLYINSISAVVDITRLHFKNGRATSNGAAIRNTGTLNLESCIFSGNHTNSSESNGGAIYNYRGIINLKACTFYGNHSEYRGGALCNNEGTINLTGNLFYGNTASAGTVMFTYYSSTSGAGVINSGGYNVGVPTAGSATWITVSSDRSLSSVPFSVNTFKPLPNSGALGVISYLPTDYPLYDFYGNQIRAGAAAGAVQEELSGNNLILTVNNDYSGSVSVSPDPDNDGYYPGNVVTLTASPTAGYVLSYWLVNGEKAGNENPKVLTLNGSVTVQAMFGICVTNPSDATGSEYVQGTLRYAISHAQYRDVIQFDEGLVIELTDVLPWIRTSITIEGNGSTLTRSSDWTEINEETQLFNIYLEDDDAVVNIRRLHFKDGRATDYGAAIYHGSGTLIIESCIFSGNRTENDEDAYGGAIFNAGTLIIQGCTFYKNSTTGGGGAVLVDVGTLTLIGNLFYGNTADILANVICWFNNSNTVISLGYNVVDLPLGILSAQSGWAAKAGDKYVSSLSFSETDFKPIADGGALNVISILPDNYPRFDFYGKAITNGAAAGAVQP